MSAPAVPGGQRRVTLQYNALGMMLSKSDVGAYVYGAQGPGAVRPHALLQVLGSGTSNYAYDANGNLVSASGAGTKYRSISYTSFNLPDSQGGLQGAGGRYTWQYDENQARIRETRANGSGTRNTWYLHPDNQGGLGFEREEASNGTAYNRHYLSAGGQAIAVLVSSGALAAPAGHDANEPAYTAAVVAIKLEYWHKDHLGSTIATSNHQGVVTARFAYDPFGKRRQVNGRYDDWGNIVIDWDGANPGNDRGYTGHEHLDDMGLIHMNGRLFDPRLGVFLQADPFIQDMLGLQNYNRYAYCHNSPLICTDPSGYFFKSLFKSVSKAFGKVVNAVVRLGYEVSGAKFIGISYKNYRVVTAIAAAVVMGPGGGAAALGFEGPMMQAAVAGFTSGAVGSGSLKGALQGAFSAAVFAGVGNVVQGGDFFAGGKGAALGKFQAVMLHGVAGCVTSAVGGGSCGDGAISAAISKAALVNGVIPEDAIAGTIASAVVGGTASALSGGSFSNGAMTGAFSYIFNHCGSGHGNGCFKSLREWLQDSPIGSLWNESTARLRDSPRPPTGGLTFLGTAGGYALSLSMSSEYEFYGGLNKGFAFDWAPSATLQYQFLPGATPGQLNSFFGGASWGGSLTAGPVTIGRSFSYDYENRNWLASWDVGISFVPTRQGPRFSAGKSAGGGYGYSCSFTPDVKC
ncbi:UNVERIFIED_ORG: RHS repeat-associated core domain-containing protein [Shinella sp. XGS7]|nr:RHS repeat-associated core domain-containing protein [Shinella sp. XGS7]